MKIDFTIQTIVLTANGDELQALYEYYTYILPKFKGLLPNTTLIYK